MPLTFLEIPDSLGWAFVFSKLNVAVTFGSFKWPRITLVPLEAYWKSFTLALFPLAQHCQIMVTSVELF